MSDSPRDRCGKAAKTAVDGYLDVVEYVRRNTLCVVRHEAKQIRGPGNPLLSRENTLASHLLYVFKNEVETCTRAGVS